MRSLLFVPADSEKKRAKALEGSADALMIWPIVCGMSMIMPSVMIKITWYDCLRCWLGAAI